MNEDKYLKLLATAIMDNPRRTTKELAEAIGISKATLHRLYGTRENLMSILEEQSKAVLDNIITVANAHYDDYRTGLRLLIEAHLDGNEFFLFSCHIQGCEEINKWKNYSDTIDSFFLRGQKDGFFKIDIVAQALTEILVADICIMIEAERRGRIASANMLSTIETIFLNGALTQKD